MPIAVRVLMSPGYGHGQKTLDIVRDLLEALGRDARLEAITVATLADAERYELRGSPTVRVNGVDIDPEAPKDVGLG